MMTFAVLLVLAVDGLYILVPVGPCIVFERL